MEIFKEKHANKIINILINNQSDNILSSLLHLTLTQNHKQKKKPTGLLKFQLQSMMMISKDKTRPKEKTMSA